MKGLVIALEDIGKTVKINNRDLQPNLYSLKELTVVMEMGTFNEHVPPSSILLPLSTINTPNTEKKPSQIKHKSKKSS